jgi:hypothetical protein
LTNGRLVPTQGQQGQPGQQGRTGTDCPCDIDPSKSDQMVEVLNKCLTDQTVRGRYNPFARSQQSTTQGPFTQQGQTTQGIRPLPGILPSNQPGQFQPDQPQSFLGQNQPGQNQPGQNQPGQNQPDQNQPGQNQQFPGQPQNQPGSNQQFPGQQPQTLPGQIQPQSTSSFPVQNSTQPKVDIMSEFKQHMERERVTDEDNRAIWTCVAKAKGILNQQGEIDQALFETKIREKFSNPEVQNNFIQSYPECKNRLTYPTDIANMHTCLLERCQSRFCQTQF